MANDLDINFKFIGQMETFQQQNETDGADYVFHQLVKKAMTRNSPVFKCEEEKEMQKETIDDTADEIAGQMFKDMLPEVMDEVLNIIQVNEMDDFPTWDKAMKKNEEKNKKRKHSEPTKDEKNKK